MRVLVSRLRVPRAGFDVAGCHRGRRFAAKALVVFAAAGRGCRARLPGCCLLPRVCVGVPEMLWLRECERLRTGVPPSAGEAGRQGARRLKSSWMRMAMCGFCPSNCWASALQGGRVGASRRPTRQGEQRKRRRTKRSEGKRSNRAHSNRGTDSHPAVRSQAGNHLLQSAPRHGHSDGQHVTRRNADSAKQLRTLAAFWRFCTATSALSRAERRSDGSHGLGPEPAHRVRSLAEQNQRQDRGDNTNSSS